MPKCSCSSNQSKVILFLFKGIQIVKFTLTSIIGTSWWSSSPLLLSKSGSAITIKLRKTNWSLISYQNIMTKSWLMRKFSRKLPFTRLPRTTKENPSRLSNLLPVIVTKSNTWWMSRSRKEPNRTWGNWWQIS